MSKTILVLINGHAGVGKDTFAGFCQTYAEQEKDCRVYNIHRSDAPKEALRTLGWNGNKDTETRILLKHMVDYMEDKGLLNTYLSEQIKAAKTVNNKGNVILFYHVRDPEVMYDLIDDYYEESVVTPRSLLITRDMEKPKEPSDWWGNLETADYMVKIALPNSLELSQEIAKRFVDFILETDYTIVRGGTNNE